MFNIDGMTISLSVGDTASIDFTATVTGYTFTSSDRAVFTIRDGSGVAVIEEAHALTNGTFTQVFQNHDTDKKSPGNYTWDVRYVINPSYGATSIPEDGDQVITPMLPQAFILLPVVGNI